MTKTTLTQEFTTATVAEGESFIIRLPLDTKNNKGALWDLRLKAGKASLEKKFYLNGPDFSGGGIVFTYPMPQKHEEVFVLHADQTGPLEIEATCKRPDGQAIKKAQSFKLTVN